MLTESVGGQDKKLNLQFSEEKNNFPACGWKATVPVICVSAHTVSWLPTNFGMKQLVKLNLKEICQ
jgi:hypothetical protein